MIRACFVMEQHLGHRAFYSSLRPQVDADPRLRADWVEVTYWQAGGRLEQARSLPSGLKGTLRGIQQVRQGLAQANYDVTVYNTQVPAALTLGRYGRAPAVLLSDITPRQYDQMGGDYGHRADRWPWLAQWKHRRNRAIFQQAAWVVPWSNWVRSSVLQDYEVPAARVQVIPPGVNLDLWQPKTAREQAGPVRLLFVGGDFERKGGPLLLEAYRYLRTYLAEDVELAIVTRAPVPEEPGVRVYRDMEPNSARLVALYQQSHIFCLPTRAEAFGIAAVEAQAAGLPAVVARSGGICDVVLHEETGLVLPPDDLATLTKALGRLITTPALRIAWGHAAHTWAATRFDIRDNARRLINLVLDAAGGNST